MSDIDLAAIVAEDARTSGAPPVVETPASVEAPAEATTAPADEAAEEQPSEAEGEQPQPKKPGGGFQKRISELTREKHEAARRAEAAEERERRLLALVEKANGGTVQQPSEDAEPRQEQFTKYEDYVRALARYDAAQAAKSVLDGHQKKAGEQDNEKARIARVTAFAEEVKRQGTDAADALEIVRSDGFPMTPAIAEYLLEADHKAALVKYLADNDDEADRISRLSEIAQVKELAKVEARFASRPKPKTSSAPPPPATVSGGAAVPQSIERMPQKDLLELVRSWDNR